MQPKIRPNKQNSKHKKTIQNKNALIFCYYESSIYNVYFVTPIHSYTMVVVACVASR